MKFVRAGGVIGAILPEGARLKLPELEGGELVYSAPLKNRFKDASISVVFAKWVRAGIAAASKPVQANEGVSAAA